MLGGNGVSCSVLSANSVAPRKPIETRGLFEVHASPHHAMLTMCILCVLRTSYLSIKMNVCHAETGPQGQTSPAQLCPAVPSRAQRQWFPAGPTAVAISRRHPTPGGFCITWTVRTAGGAMCTWCPS